MRDLDEIYPYFDQPCGQMALTYSYRLFEAVAKEAKVALTGNGADELFGGYSGDESLCDRTPIGELDGLAAQTVRENTVQCTTHTFTALSSAAPPAVRWTAVQLVNAVNGLCGSEAVRVDAMSIIDSIFADLLESGAEHELDVKMQLSLQHTNAEAVYRIPDVVGYLAGVETRSPFLGFRMVDLASRIGPDLKVERADGSRSPKVIPKTYFAKLASPELAWRRKLGMPQAWTFA